MPKKKLNDIEKYSIEYNKKYKISDDFILDHRGLRYIKYDKKEERDIEIILTSVPFFIESKIKNLITGNKKIEVVFFENWKKESIIIDYYDTGDTRALMKQLRTKGISVDVNNAKIFIQFFSKFWDMNHYKLPEIQTTNQLGWFNDEFVPYSKKYKLDITDDLKDEITWIETKGNRNDWIDKAKKYRENKYFRFLLASSYASPLLKMLKGRSMVIHNNGPSRTGKTTASYFAMSIWGDPEKNKIPYSSSKFAIETKLSLRNNFPSLLDENSEMTTAELNKLLYMIGNGKNDAKGTKTGGLRELKTWNCFVLSTAEIPLIRDEQNEGIYNRTLEGKWKPFDNAQNAKECYDFLIDNYGHTGKEFIDYTLKNKSSLKDIKAKFENDLTNNLNLEEHIRTVSVICVADYMTKIFFGGSYKESLELGKFILKSLISVDDVNTSKKAIEYLRDVILQQQFNFITDNNKDIREPLGHIINDIYYVYTHVARALLEKRGFNYKKTKDYLKSENMAMFDSKGDFRSCMINRKKTRMIQLTDKFFEDEKEKETIDLNSILNQLKFINSDNVRSYSELDIQALKKEIERISMIYNREQINMFSKESKANQGDTLSKIINSNVKEKEEERNETIINGLTVILENEFQNNKDKFKNNEDLFKKYRFCLTGLILNPNKDFIDKYSEFVHKCNKEEYTESEEYGFKLHELLEDLEAIESKLKGGAIYV
jgi:hypothetical protein